jgi:hypothetical protein
MPDVVDISDIFHSQTLDYWTEAQKTYEKEAYTYRTLHERIAEPEERKADGDTILARVRDTFMNGLGIQWGEDQIRVFNAFVFASLPLIYGDSWPREKGRVLEEWGATRECPYTLVSMARRNGKTFVTSGTVVSLLICVPAIKIAIFSTCKRTSMMMMSAAVEMLEKAFDKGTHCNSHDYKQISRNMESIVFQGPDATKRTLGCFPGSVRVRTLFVSCAAGGVEACT